MRPDPDLAGWIGLGALVSLAATLGLAPLADGAMLGVYAAMFAPWAALLWVSGQTSLRWSHLLAAAVAARVVLLAAEPVFSDDIYRYIWDGRVAQSGVNPYLWAPGAEALAHLRDAGLWAQINHPEVPTIYPPAAQMLFRAHAALAEGTAALRAMLLIVEAAGAALVWAILRHTAPRFDDRALKRAFVVYALCPLVIVEVAFSGHIDVLAWMPLVAALLLFVRSVSTRAALGAGALLGLSVAAKFLGLIALPLVLLAPRRSEVPLGCAVARRLGFVAAAAAVVAACYLPYADAGSKLFSGFGNYAAVWQGNDGPFRLAAGLGESTLEAWAPEESEHIERADGELIFRFDRHDELFEELGLTRTWRGEQVPATSFSAEQIAQAVAKAVAVFFVALALLWAILVRRDPLGGTLAVLLVLFLVAPIVHPWYVAWLVPLAALRPSKAALVFSFTVLAAYLAWLSARHGGPWRVPTWVVAIEFGAVGLVAFWEMTDRDGNIRLQGHEHRRAHRDPRVDSQ